PGAMEALRAPPLPRDEGASFTVDLPGPDVVPQKSPSSPPEERASRRPPRRHSIVETRGLRSSEDPRAEPESDRSIAARETQERERAKRQSTKPPPANMPPPESLRPTPMRPPSKQPAKIEIPRDEDEMVTIPRHPGPSSKAPPAGSYMAGAEHPLSKTESP